MPLIHCGCIRPAGQAGSSVDLRLSAWSSVTSALAQDSGWYEPNSAADGYLEWGRDAGCTFATFSCGQYTASVPSQPFFCTEEELAEGAPTRMCEPDGLASVKCELDPLVGDDCYVKTRFLWEGASPDPEVCATRDSRCTFRYNEPNDNSPAYGLSWGPDSRCAAFSESLAPAGSISTWPVENSPDCFLMDCEAGQLYLTLPMGNSGEDARLLCPEGGELDARGAGYVSGVFTCPTDVEAYCASLACPNSCRYDACRRNCTCVGQAFGYRHILLV